MDAYEAAELRRDTLFKDAVLNAAQAQAMEIISAAQKASGEQLQQAQAACAQADHAHLAATVARDAEKEHSTALQVARQELLALREQLVDGVFAEVEQQLADFVAGKEYVAWLVKKAEKHARLKTSEGGALVQLRPGDLAHAKALEKALPGCRVQADEHIRLGGLKLSDGRVLYDETLDAALTAEREAFYHTSGLTL